MFGIDSTSQHNILLILLVFLKIKLSVYYRPGNLRLSDNVVQKGPWSEEKEREIETLFV